MYVQKRTLGEAYVVATGVVLGVALLAHAAAALALGPVAVGLVVAGLAPAAALAGARYWLPRTGLSGEQVWSVATWSGLGIGLLTLVNVAVLVTDTTLSALAPILLASSIAVGAGGGFLVGTLVELRRSARRLECTNDVLTRVLRHNLGNDLTVILGHLGELEDEVPPAATRRVRRLQRKVDEVVTTTEKARQIDVALGTAGATRQPVDLVPHVDRAVDAVERAHPEAVVTLDTPEHCWAMADWLLPSVVDNVVENAVVHAQGPPTIGITMRAVGDDVELRVRDDCPAIPENERAVFERGVETPLEHSTGVGLWLVQVVVEGYGGTAHVEAVDDGGNELVIRLPRASGRDRFAGVRTRLELLGRRLGTLRDVVAVRPRKRS